MKFAYADPRDILDDLFPGTGVMGKTAEEILERPEDFAVGLFSEAAE